MPPEGHVSPAGECGRVTNGRTIFQSRPRGRLCLAALPGSYAENLTFIAFSILRDTRETVYVITAVFLPG